MTWLSISCLKYKKFTLICSVKSATLIIQALNMYCSQVMPVHSKKAEFKWKVPEEAKHSLCFFF